MFSPILSQTDIILKEFYEEKKIKIKTEFNGFDFF